MSDKQLLPEVIVFAGPNGSGKTTIKKNARTVGKYINADDIKLTIHCTDKAAAKTAEKLRETAVQNHDDFTFETVLSTDRNLKLLKKAKDKGYFIRGFFILTKNADINVARVRVRVLDGGHDVPEDKIRSRYIKSLALLPSLIEVCDVLHVYDNTIEPVRIFKKRKTKYIAYKNELWSFENIEKLTKVTNYSKA